jgi:hypothetical protein
MLVIQGAAIIKIVEALSSNGERQRRKVMSLYSFRVVLVFIFAGVFSLVYAQKSEMDAYSTIQPRVIRLDLPVADAGIGGLITADVNNDSLNDFIITKPNHIVVYDHSGKKLWAKRVNIQVTGPAEQYGLPGWHGPGVQAADVDGDGSVEVLYLTKDGVLHIVHGSTGRGKWSERLDVPAGAERWEHSVVANFRGKGDRDLLLQATNATGYRMGRYLAAYAVEDLRDKKLRLLWQRDDFVANAHNGARVADLNGDRRDEVLGGTVIGPDGNILFRIPLRGHIDSIFVGDILPEIPGLEIAALEEGGGNGILRNNNGLFRTVNRVYDHIFPAGNRVFLYNHERLIWQSHYRHQEPQNAAVGNFDPSRPGLEVWCRSRYERHQIPFIFDARGQLINFYKMDDVAPEGWTTKGVEEIWTIDWTGDDKQLAAAKERHMSGDVAIFDPISGKFLHRFKEKADRLYVADVSGDWREEIIVLNGNELRIYENNEPNLNADRPRLWDQHHYRRSKMTWNYYSP